MNLKQLFKQENLKQSYVANKLKIKQQQVSYWLTGRNMPNIKQLPTLIKILNCSYEGLILAIIETKGSNNEK